ncbi:MAG: hypothetical protein M5R40_09490 [Anaerolineae bacterium]|nr:hypothetical protein [Anaerolineae bacterium]
MPRQRRDAAVHRPERDRRPSAIQWLNTDPAGQAWAQQRGVAVPLQAPPAQYCTADTQPGAVRISAPVNGQTVSSAIEVRGTVSIPNFHRYQLEYAAGTVSPGVVASWSLAAGPYTNQPVGDAVLAVWDTRALADGVYTIRILAIDTQGKQLDDRVTVMVTNLVPTTPPTVTVTLTPSLTNTPFIIPTFTPPPPTVIPTNTFTPTPTFTPTAIPLPSETPIPTFTPESTDTPTWTPTASEMGSP